MSKFEDLKEFINIAKDSGARKLEYEMKDKKFYVSFENEGAVVMPSMPAMPAVAPVAASTSSTPAVDDGLIEVTSPFVGTFYRSSSPTADPFVKVGDRINNGKVLCIVEAMKIMNEIEAEITGEIVEVCVENETYVEFGQALFKIKP
jgi:acetyl-CoA carboxylase biotin carboxyl carrier protein